MLSVIVPIYNEDSIFIELLKRISAVPLEKEIIVIDDGSAISIENLIRETAIPEVKFLAHPFNRGKGAAIRTGLSHATGEIAIIQDADFEYHPEDYLELLRVYKENKAKAVYGVRDLSTRSFLMRFGNTFLTKLTNILFQSDLKDMETCYKLVDLDLLRSLELTSNRFEIEAEISAKLIRTGIKIYQAPIKYSPRTEGKKLTVLDGLPAVVTLLRCLFWYPSAVNRDIPQLKGSIPKNLD